MSTPSPVPSKAALRALRSIVIGTSCSLALLAEERRRRTERARTIVENGQLIRAHQTLHRQLQRRLRPDADIHETHPPRTRSSGQTHPPPPQTSTSPEQRPTHSNSGGKHHAFRSNHSSPSSLPDLSLSDPSSLHPSSLQEKTHDPRRNVSTLHDPPTPHHLASVPLFIDENGQVWLDSIASLFSQRPLLPLATSPPLSVPTVSVPAVSLPFLSVSLPPHTPPESAPRPSDHSALSCSLASPPDSSRASPDQQPPPLLTSASSLHSTAITIPKGSRPYPPSPHNHPPDSRRNHPTHPQFSYPSHPPPPSPISSYPTRTFSSRAASTLPSTAHILPSRNTLTLPSHASIPPSPNTSTRGTPSPIRSYSSSSSSSSSSPYPPTSSKFSTSRTASQKLSVSFDDILSRRRKKGRPPPPEPILPSPVASMVDPPPTRQFIFHSTQRSHESPPSPPLASPEHVLHQLQALGPSSRSTSPLSPPSESAPLPPPPSIPLPSLRELTRVASQRYVPRPPYPRPFQSDTFLKAFRFIGWPSFWFNKTAPRKLKLPPDVFASIQPTDEIRALQAYLANTPLPSSQNAASKEQGPPRGQVKQVPTELLELFFFAYESVAHRQLLPADMAQLSIQMCDYLLAHGDVDAAALCFCLVAADERMTEKWYMAHDVVGLLEALWTSACTSTSTSDLSEQDASVLYRVELMVDILAYRPVLKPQLLSELARRDPSSDPSPSSTTHGQTSPLASKTLSNPPAKSRTEPKPPRSSSRSFSSQRDKAKLENPYSPIYALLADLFQNEAHGLALRTFLHRCQSVYRKNAKSLVAGVNAVYLRRLASRPSSSPRDPSSSHDPSAVWERWQRYLVQAGIISAQSVSTNTGSAAAAAASSPALNPEEAMDLQEMMIKQDAEEAWDHVLASYDRLLAHGHWGSEATLQLAVKAALLRDSPLGEKPLAILERAMSLGCGVYNTARLLMSHAIRFIEMYATSEHPPPVGPTHIRSSADGNSLSLDRSSLEADQDQQQHQSQGNPEAMLTVAPSIFQAINHQFHRLHPFYSPPNEVTYNQAARACLRAREYHNALRLILTASKLHGDEDPIFSVFAFSNLLFMTTALRRYNVARQLLALLPSQVYKTHPVCRKALLRARRRLAVAVETSRSRTAKRRHTLMLHDVTNTYRYVRVCRFIERQRRCQRPDRIEELRPIWEKHVNPPSLVLPRVDREVRTDGDGGHDSSAAYHAEYSGDDEEDVMMSVTIDQDPELLQHFRRRLVTTLERMQAPPYVNDYGVMMLKIQQRREQQQQQQNTNPSSGQIVTAHRQRRRRLTFWVERPRLLWKRK